MAVVSLGGVAFWRGSRIRLDSERALILLSDDQLLEDILALSEGGRLIYLDYSKVVNDWTRSLFKTPAYDAFVVYRNFTPMPNLCDKGTQKSLAE